MATQLVKFHIEGLTSLLMNNPASMAGPKTNLGVKKIPSPEDEAATKVYQLEDGQLYAKSIWFRQAIWYAAGGRKIGKNTARSRVQAAVFTAENECPLYDPKTKKPIKKYDINITRAVIQKSGVMRARPEIKKWACDVVFEIDEDFVSPEIIEELLIAAGKVSGCGDFRPQKNGPHGRFNAHIVK